MSTVQRYDFSIDDLAKARGESGDLSFKGGSPESFAELLRTALAEPTLWNRWRAMQPDPDAIDAALGVSDPNAKVEAQQSDLHINVQITTALSYAIIKHRLTVLIGKHWTLRDVNPA